MQPHGIRRRVVQNQREVIKLRDPSEPAGQVVEQRRQVAVRDDRFRHVQAVLHTGCRRRSGSFLLGRP